MSSDVVRPLNTPAPAAVEATGRGRRGRCSGEASTSESAQYTTRGGSMMSGGERKFRAATSWLSWTLAGG